VSHMTKKDQSSNGSTGHKAVNAAQQTVAQVVPVAKNAGQAARQGALAARVWAEPQVRAARSWAEPQVRAARSWAAPRVEQAGLTVRDKIGPTVSSALVEASHRLDVTPQQPRKRRWPRMVAGFAMLAAAASAAAAVFLKRQAEVILTQEDQPMEGGATAASRGDGATSAPAGPGPSQTPPAAGETGPYSDDLLP
jgi:hypothetical protein